MKLLTQGLLEDGRVEANHVLMHRNGRCSHPRGCHHLALGLCNVLELLTLAEPQRMGSGFHDESKKLAEENAWASQYKQGILKGKGAVLAVDQAWALGLPLDLLHLHQGLFWNLVPHHREDIAEQA